MSDPLGTTFRRHALHLLLIGMLSPAPVSAQTDVIAPRSDRMWFSAGVGVGRARASKPEPLNFAIGLSVNYQPSLVVFRLRSTGVWGVLDGNLLGDVAQLAGVGTHERGSHLSVAVGPALAGGSLGVFHSHPSSFKSTLGLGVDVQGFGIAFDAFGLGLNGFANLNSQYSFGGVTLSLAFGKLG